MLIDQLTAYAKIPNTMETKVEYSLHRFEGLAGHTGVCVIRVKIGAETEAVALPSDVDDTLAKTCLHTLAKCLVTLCTVRDVLEDWFYERFNKTSNS